MLLAEAAHILCKTDAHRDFNFGGLSMNSFTITAQPRDVQMTTKALRRSGVVPCIIYGRGFEATSIQVQYPQLARLVSRVGSSMISINVDGIDTPYDTLIREVQRDPIYSKILHVDFLAVQANQVIRNVIPIIQHGSAPVEQRGGVVIQMLERLEIECLPRYMPHAILIDVSKLEAFNSHLTVADCIIPEYVTVLSPRDAEVVHAMAPMREEVVEVAATTEVVAEGAEGVGTEAKGEEGTGKPEDKK
jgi:large subunit ribosomal protein L25